VVVRVNVKADGTVETVDVTTGTGYPALDHAAVDAVKAWRFAAATDEQGKAVAGAATFALTFTPPARDLDPDATCGQLNTEVAELRARFPEASLDQVPLLGPYKDMAEATDEALPASMRGAILAEFPQLLEKVVAACAAAQPEEELFSTYLAVLSPDEPRKKRRKN
jgi:TonB family protein